MNKKRTVYTLFANKRVKKVIGTFLILVVIGIGSVFGMNSFKEKKEEVSAHPTNTIKLDEGGANEFELPFDAKELKEQAIKDLTPPFKEYVQGEAEVPIMNKSVITAYGSTPAIKNGKILPIGCDIIDVEETKGGNYFVLFSISGSDTGGIARTAVYDKRGNQLAVDNEGTKINLNHRILSKLFNKEGNAFLVSAENGDFFRYTVNEVGGSVNIERTLFEKKDVGNPGAGIGVISMAIIDQFSDYSDDALITGRSTYTGGIYNKRISVGTVNTSGWTGDKFNAKSSHHYTLQSLLVEENLGLFETFNGGVMGSLGAGLYKRNNYTFGNINYVVTVNGSESPRSLRTFQIFSNEDIGDTEVSSNGGEVFPIVKKRVYQHLDIATIRKNVLANKMITYSVVKSLCNDEFVYFFADDGKNCELIRVNLTTFQDEVVKTYPAGTIINFYPDGQGGFAYYGSTPKLSGEFYSEYYSNRLSSNYYFISGAMTGITGSSEDLNVRSLRAIEVGGVVSASFALEGENNEIFIAGYTKDYDSFPTHKYMIDENIEPSFTAESGVPSAESALIGTLKIEDDYAPIIKQENSITVDLTDGHILNPTDANYLGWSTLDRWLITGKKNGTVSNGTDPDSTAIEVYDHFDSNDSAIAGTAAGRAEWLQKRINRNPKNSTAAIAWEKLGFDKTTTGPQLVTYFVTDSQSQPSVTSRWVNKKGTETIVDEDDKYALDAQNFHIPLTGIDSTIPDENKFKELAKTMAWSLTKHGSTDGDQGGGLDEDGSDSSKLSTKVTVDTVQLKALREATVAKPYPVDVAYKPESGIEIKNRVWVFVTTKNTVPNSETNPKVTPIDTNGVVYYADDYSLPYRLRGEHTAADVLNRGNVRVYDYYDSTHETDAELPVLADKTTNPAKLQVVNLNAIKTATQPNLIDSSPPDGPAMIRYEWDGPVDGNHQSGTTKPTLGGLDVTLTGDILLHVRQVIVGDSNQLVVPEEGYLRMATNDYDGVSGTTTENADQLRQVRISSGKNADNPAFETIAVNAEHMDDPLDELELKLIIPEYYESVGNYLTLGNVDANGTSHSGKTEADSNKASLIFQRDDLYDDEEYFITIYLKPKLNQEGPQPYSWDYKKNDLGKIKTK
ncbi:hypothetical protein [Enterococcus sp. AZ163]|uniref:hypothetical protein n=1 Tax=Enterococcus sp. AZ163 TaxID=2774638 RepID=UPI003D2B39CE